MINAAALLSTLAGGGWRKLALALIGVIVLLVLLAFVAWRGYRAGYDKADALRRAEVGDIRTAHAQALAGRRGRGAATADRGHGSRRQGGGPIPGRNQDHRGPAPAR